MQVMFVIVASLPCPDAAVAQSVWHGDISGAAFREAWDRNEGTESLAGLVAGLDRGVWRRIAVRAELVALRVQQADADAWMRGMTVGTRLRWRHRAPSPFLDIAVGVADATTRVPPGGTTFNYLALAGGGVEVPVGRAVMTVTGRWLHASNNGREGRHLNPDIQALGVLVGVGWEF